MTQEVGREKIILAYVIIRKIEAEIIAVHCAMEILIQTLVEHALVKDNLEIV